MTGAHLRECSHRDPARLASSAGSSSSLPCLRFMHVHVAGCSSSSEVSLFSSSLSSPSESVERSSVEQYSSPLSLSSPLTESGGLRNVRCPMYLGSSLSTGLLRPDRVVARCVLGGNGGALFLNLSEWGCPACFLWVQLTKARRRLSLSRRDVSASAVQAAVSPTGATIGSVTGKYIGVRVGFMRVLVVCVGGVPSS